MSHRPPPSRFGPNKSFNRGFKLSVLLHLIALVVFLLAGAIEQLFKSDHSNSKRKEKRNAIRVDVVDLPSKRIYDLKKIDPSQKPDLKTPAKKAEEKAKADSKKMLLPDDQKKKAKVEKKSKKKSASSRKERLKKIQERLAADERRKKLMEKLKGEAGGRPVLEGNIVSEGLSVTGDVATDHETYIARVKAHLLKNWNPEEWMRASNLAASVLVKISSSGRVLSKTFVRKSGNDEYDQSIITAIDLADPFPKPTEESRIRAIEEGIECGFPK